jgi:uncharacterized membrane protein
MADVPAGKVSPNRTVMIVLAYLWLLALIPLLVEKEDAEVQWHAKNGLVLTAAEIVLWIVLSILTMIPFLGCLLLIVHLFLWLGIVVLHVIAIVKGVNGGRLVVPVLSDYTSKF